MKTTYTNTIIVAAFAFLGAVFASESAQKFTLSSTDIAEGQQLDIAHVYQGFGYNGENKSPQLSWSHAPQGTKSFVVTVYDPDAPTGSGWWHWVAFNIPADVTSLANNASASGNMPEGVVQSITDYGEKKFGGAAPPRGNVHRYIFTVYALNVDKLDLKDTASPALVGFMTKMHAIGSAKITAVYTGN